MQVWTWGLKISATVGKWLFLHRGKWEVYLFNLQRYCCSNEGLRCETTIRPTPHTLVLSENKRLRKWQLACKVNKSFFFRVQASYEVAQLIARHGRPFSEGEFIKQCLTRVAGITCLHKMQDLNNVSMSRYTVVWCIEDLSANIKLQVSDKACAFDFYSIVDATDTAQLLIFLRGIDDSLCIMKELLDLSSLKGTTTGKDMLYRIQLTRWDFSGKTCVEL